MLKDKLRIEHLKQLFLFDETRASLFLPKHEEEWCFSHNLVQSSLNHVSELCMYASLLYHLIMFLILKYNNAGVTKYLPNFRCQMKYDMTYMSFKTI